MSIGVWSLLIIVAMTAAIMGAFAGSWLGAVTVGVAIVALFILFEVRLSGDGS